MCDGGRTDNGEMPFWGVKVIFVSANFHTFPCKTCIWNRISFQYQRQMYEKSCATRLMKWHQKSCDMTSNISKVCKTPVREPGNSCDNDGISLETPVRWEKSLWDDVRFFHISSDINEILLETLVRSKKSLWDDVRCFQISWQYLGIPIEALWGDVKSYFGTPVRWSQIFS